MTTAAAENIKSLPAVDPEIEAMLEAGVHLGHARSRRHPAMAPYIWGVRSNVEIIDLTRTREKLAEALAFLKQAAQEKKLFLIVGTRPSARDPVKKTAEEIGCPYVSQRWIGGTLTNFKVILKRIETMEGLEHDKASGGFEKYTKKERLEKEKDIQRLTRNFDGLRRLRKLPDALIIVDIAHDSLALREARRMNIPVAALTDTNTDPRSVSYAIPSNDDARPAIAYMLGRIKQAILEGQSLAESTPQVAVPESQTSTQESSDGKGDSNSLNV